MCRQRRITSSKVKLKNALKHLGTHEDAQDFFADQSVPVLDWLGALHDGQGRHLGFHCFAGLLGELVQHFGPVLQVFSQDLSSWQLYDPTALKLHKEQG